MLSRSISECQSPTSTAFYWPSNTKYHPAPPHTDPVLPRTKQYCHIVTKYHQVRTSTALYWPSTTKYQPVPLYPDPVPPSINPYRLILTQYHQESTGTIMYQTVHSIVTIKHLTLYGRRAFHTFCFPNSTFRHFFVDLSIPDICHGRHGHVRVNFFWPV